jgi:hypothetical protein
MNLHHSAARFSFGAKPTRQASRLHIGTLMLAGVVGLLALLNPLAGAA